MIPELFFTATENRLPKNKAADTGQNERAKIIREAVARVVKEGKVRAYDMLKLPGSQKVLDQGAASTAEMANEIINYL